MYCTADPQGLSLKLSWVGLPISWLTHVSHTVADLKQKRDFIIRMLGGSQNFLLRLENQARKLRSQEDFVLSSPATGLCSENAQ